MCIICNQDDINEDLDVSNCPNITEIPCLIGLQKLHCRYCFLLKEIFPIPSLIELDCSGCPLLTNIPFIPGLKILYCINCPLLRKIPKKYLLKVYQAK